MQYNTVLKHDQQLHEMLILLCNHIIDLKKKILCNQVMLSV